MAKVVARVWMTQAEQDALEMGISPVEFLINTFRDENYALDIKMEAAKALLPYAAKRAPQAVEVTGANGGDITFREQSAIRNRLAQLIGVEG